MVDFNLTDEERARMNKKSVLCVQPKPVRDMYVGDAVSCPRCHRGAVVANATQPCTACQLKDAQDHIEKLNAKIKELMNGAPKG